MLRTFLESNVIWKAFFYYFSHKQCFISCWNQHVGSFWISHLSVISSPDWLWLSERWKKKTKKQTKKNQAAQDKKPNEASGRKITQDALQSPHTTAKCHFTQSFTADTKPTRSTMVPYCKGRKGACYCEKKTTCNIYLCYIILICRRSLHFWYQQRKTLSFCRSH